MNRDKIENIIKTINNNTSNDDNSVCIKMLDYLAF